MNKKVLAEHSSNVNPPPSKISVWPCGDPDCGIFHLTKEETMECAGIVQVDAWKCSICGQVWLTLLGANNCCNIEFWGRQIVAYEAKLQAMNPYYSYDVYSEISKAQSMLEKARKAHEEKKNGRKSQ